MSLAERKQTPLSRKHATARELARMQFDRNVKEVARWWNQHAGGMKFEQDIDSWITDRFTAIEARRSLAPTAASQSMDEINQEGEMIKAFKVARGRHLVSEFVVQKYVFEAKAYVIRRRCDVSIALDYVRDRLSSDGALFDVLGVTSESKREKLLELVV